MGMYHILQTSVSLSGQELALCILALPSLYCQLLQNVNHGHRG